MTVSGSECSHRKLLRAASVDLESTDWCLREKVVKYSCIEATPSHLPGCWNQNYVNRGAIHVGEAYLSVSGALHKYWFQRRNERQKWWNRGWSYCYDWLFYSAGAVGACGIPGFSWAAPAAKRDDGRDCDSRTRYHCHTSYLDWLMHIKGTSLHTRQLIFLDTPYPLLTETLFVSLSKQRIWKLPLSIMI